MAPTSEPAEGRQSTHKWKYIFRKELPDKYPGEDKPEHLQSALSLENAPSFALLLAADGAPTSPACYGRRRLAVATMGRHRQGLGSGWVGLGRQRGRRVTHPWRQRKTRRARYPAVSGPSLVTYPAKHQRNDRTHYCVVIQLTIRCKVSRPLSLCTSIGNDPDQHMFLDCEWARVQTKCPFPNVDSIVGKRAGHKSTQWL